jgi:hypothetical protein
MHQAMTTRRSIATSCRLPSTRARAAWVRAARLALLAILGLGLAAGPAAAQAREGRRSRRGSTPAQPATPRPADTVELFDYTVQAGDTCIGIAQRVLGDRAAYELIHQHNPDLGPSPHKLVAGTVLKLPRVGEKSDGPPPDARLTDKLGQVAVKEPAAADWQHALRGMPLFRQWRVRSQQRSSAEVTFRDGAAIQMRENTVMIIYGPSRRPTLQRVLTASLESGALRTRLAELDRSTTLVVETPSAESRVQAGEAWVSVDDGGTSRVANHRGGAVRVRARQRGRARGRTVRVSEGMGSQVDPGKEPSPPRPLPATPAWVAGERAFAGDAERGGRIRGAWEAVDGAARYRIEVAASADGKALVASAEAPASATDFEMHRLPPGTYHVSISAIDGQGFEGKPSPREAMTVVALQVRALGAAAPATRPAGQDPAATGQDGDLSPEKSVGQIAEPAGSEETGDIDLTAPVAARAVVHGSTIIAPDGMTCALGQDGAGAATVLLAEVGAHEIHCRDAEGRALAPLAIEVFALAVRPVATDAASGNAAGDATPEVTGDATPEVTSDAADSTAGPAPLPRNTATRVRIAIETEGVDPAALTVLAPAGVELGDPEVVPPNMIEVAVTAGADAGDQVALRVVPRGAEQLVLAEIALAVEPLPAPKLEAPVVEAPAPPRRISWELGLHGGAILRGSRYELGRTLLNTGVVDDAPFVGVRAGIALHPRVFLEAELSATRVALDIPGQPSADVIGYGGQLRTPFELSSRLQAFALAGVGAHYLRPDTPDVLRDTDPDFYYGLGASFGVTDFLAVRVDARHVLSAAYDDAFAAHLFDLSLGIVWQPARSR